MTNEEKQQLKARFFGMHIGCKIANGNTLVDIRHSPTDVDPKRYMFDIMDNDGNKYADSKPILLLRPLSSITDQEAIECAKIYNDEGSWVFYKRNEYFAQVVDKKHDELFTIWFPEDDTSIITLLDSADNTCAFNQFTCIDWLRGRNFCLPFIGLSPIEEGWAILESENQP